MLEAGIKFRQLPAHLSLPNLWASAFPSQTIWLFPQVSLSVSSSKSINLILATHSKPNYYLRPHNLPQRKLESHYMNLERIQTPSIVNELRWLVILLGLYYLTLESVGCTACWHFIKWRYSEVNSGSSGQAKHLTVGLTRQTSGALIPPFCLCHLRFLSSLTWFSAALMASRPTRDLQHGPGPVALASVGSHLRCTLWVLSRI